MNKEELAKKYQEIVLRTNGGADDYVVALCQIANLIAEAGKEIEKQTKQLAELKAENERLLEANDSLSNKFDKDSDMQNKIDTLTLNNEALQQQLKEKDEEISRLKNEIILHDENEQKNINEFISLTTKQVCEKIREKFSDGRSHNWGIEQVELYDFLDQIEKGESK